MDIVLGGVFVIAMPWLALATVVTPPVVMIARRSWPVPAIALWLAAFPLAAEWGIAGIRDMDRADATGGAGNAFAGVVWLVAALVVAAASVWWTMHRRRRAA